MGCFAPDAPPPVDYGKQTASTLNAQVELAPKLYASEAQFQPKYDALTLSNLNLLLNGSKGGTTAYNTPMSAGQSGWYDPSGNFLSPGELVTPSATGRIANGVMHGGNGGKPMYNPGAMPMPGAVWRNAGEGFSIPGTQTTSAQPGVFDLLRDQASTQRASDIHDVATLGPEARAAILASNPDQAALLQKLNAQANSELDAGSTLTPDQVRAMQQASRAAFAARGMGGSTGALSDEILRQFNLGQQLLSQRQQFAQSVLGNNQAVVGDPFMQILGRGSNALGQASGLQQQSGPQLFNPESPLSANITAGNQAYQAMFADPSTMSKASAVTGVVGSLIGGIAGGMI